MSEQTNREKEIQEIEQKLSERIHFEELIFHINQHNFDEVCSLLPNFMCYKQFTQKLIVNAAITNIFSFKLFKDLLERTGPIEIKFSCYDSFSQYLFAIGMIQENDFFEFDLEEFDEMPTIDEFENPLKPETLPYIIYQDDVKAFVSFIASNNIDIFQPFSLNIVSKLFELIIDFVSYCGSMNIFKYLLINGDVITEEVVWNSLCSGNEEMIQYIAEKGFSYDDSILCTVKYHHNNVAKWLIENTNQFDAKLSYCVVYSNTELFLYMLNELKYDINQVDFHNKVSIIRCADENDILLAKYLILKGIDKEIEDDQHKIAIEYAQTDEMRELLK